MMRIGRKKLNIERSGRRVGKLLLCGSIINNENK